VSPRVAPLALLGIPSTALRSQADCADFPTRCAVGLQSVCPRVRADQERIGFIRLYPM
jgi:hypothetical protein